MLGGAQVVTVYVRDSAMMIPLCYPPGYDTGGHRLIPSCHDMSFYGAHNAPKRPTCLLEANYAASLKLIQPCKGLSNEPSGHAACSINLALWLTVLRPYTSHLSLVHVLPVHNLRSPSRTVGFMPFCTFTPRTPRPHSYHTSLRARTRLDSLRQRLLAAELLHRLLQLWIWADRCDASKSHQNVLLCPRDICRHLQQGTGGAVTPVRSRESQQLDHRCQSSTGFPKEGKQQGSEPVSPSEGRDDVGHHGSRIMGVGGGASCSASHGCVIVRLLAPHLGEPGSIPGGVTPGFWLELTVSGEAANQRLFSRISRFPLPCIPVLLHTHLNPVLSLGRSNSGQPRLAIPDPPPETFIKTVHDKDFQSAQFTANSLQQECSIPMCRGARLLIRASVYLEPVNAVETRSEVEVATAPSADFTCFREYLTLTPPRRVGLALLTVPLGLNFTVSTTQIRTISDTAKFLASTKPVSYDYFGKYIVPLLRDMDPTDAVELQHDITGSMLKKMQKPPTMAKNPASVQCSSDQGCSVDTIAAKRKGSNRVQGPDQDWGTSHLPIPACCLMPEAARWKYEQAANCWPTVSGLRWLDVITMPVLRWLDVTMPGLRRLVLVTMPSLRRLDVKSVMSQQRPCGHTQKVAYCGAIIAVLRNSDNAWRLLRFTRTQSPTGCASLSKLALLPTGYCLRRNIPCGLDCWLSSVPRTQGNILLTPAGEPPREHITGHLVTTNKDYYYSPFFLAVDWKGAGMRVRSARVSRIDYDNLRRLHTHVVERGSCTHTGTNRFSRCQHQRSRNVRYTRKGTGVGSISLSLSAENELHHIEIRAGYPQAAA
ncbi:hypothetical protein PR048_015638 [Dryococelus australis]|uniref:Uncharacterized protein n=1 Tax=Dryococelus australis TaxID=614101 RepID=A0ABQ9HHI2_9NEOP|nr:hypothetical protein PR048_015638 [Dryococelus australis]